MGDDGNRVLSIATAQLLNCSTATITSCPRSTGFGRFSSYDYTVCKESHMTIELEHFLAAERTSSPAFDDDEAP
jgi:hypothetical protein